jgi:hypothetical protein
MTKHRVLVLCFPYFRDNSIVTWGCSGFFEVIFVWGLVDPTHNNPCHFSCGGKMASEKCLWSISRLYVYTTTHTKRKINSRIKDQWPEPSQGRPKKGQKTNNSQEPKKKGEN